MTKHAEQDASHRRKGHSMKRSMMGKRLAALLCALLLTATLLPSVAYGTTTSDGAAKTDETKTNTTKTETTTTDTKAEDKTTDSKKDDADAIRKEYQDLQDQINNKRKEMDDLKNQLNNIKNQKANTQQQKNLLDQRNAALQAEINLLEEQIDVTTRSIAANEALEKQQTELFHKQIRSEEEQGTISYWSVLFKATSFSDLVSRIDFINEIVRYNQQVIKNLRDTRQQLADDKAALEEQNESLTASKKELEGEISESMRLLAEYIKTEEGKQAEYDAIKAEEEALDDLMAAAEAKARELGLNDIAGTVGGYIWPCNGIRWITSMFGGRQSPGGIGSTNHRGVDIGGVGTTSAALATKSGKVIIAKTVVYGSYGGSGYGNYVVLDHGGGYTTLYAHLSSVSVSVGDMVTQGDTVGITGSTGNSTGPHLHYEVMINGVNQNPLDYLPGYIARW